MARKARMIEKYIEDELWKYVKILKRNEKEINYIG